MKQLKRWLLWDREIKTDKDGEVQKDSQGNIKYTKVPKRLNGYKASKTNPAHFLTFDEALKAYNTDGFSGLGFVLVESDPYVIIDLDDCFNNGHLTDKAKMIVDSLDSFTEVSQSGNGLHIVVRADNIEGFNNHDEHVEMYSKKWFFCMTGNVLRDDLITIEDRNEIVSFLHDTYSTNNKKQSMQQIEDQPEMFSDDELVAKIRNSKQGDKFSTLYDKGDISNYESDSEADYGLANILAFWTKNSLQIERIMRNSALYRDKWDKHPDYLQRTVNNALHNNADSGYKTGDNFQLHVNGQQTIMPDPFINKNGSLWYVKKGKSENEPDTEIYVSRHIPIIDKEFHNVEGSQVFYQVSWKQDNRTVNEVVPASTIANATELIELSNQGLSVNTNNRANLVKFMDFYQLYNDIEKHLAVERLGNIQGEYIHPILTNEVEIMAMDHGEKQILESFEVKGTAETWKREIFERIKDQPKAVFMLLASFASVIIKDLGVKPFIAEVSGDTSQGKTTVLEMASTVWGNGHLVNEWNATPVVIERKAAYLNSYPLLMDDTRKATERTLKNIIYQFSGGRSKGRGSVKGSQKEYTWNNILLSTGEVSLNDYAQTQGGAAARVIPLGDEPLKRDYEMIVDLQDAMTENYGAIGIDFLKSWNEHKNELIPEFKKVKKLYVRKSGDNNVLNRLAEFYAAVHFTGQVVQDYLGMDIDLSAIVTLFDEIAEENKDVDKPMKFLEDILTDLDSKRDNISSKYQPYDPVMAIYRYEKDQLYLLPSYVKDFLGLEESQTRKTWLKRGITTGTEQKGKKVDYMTIKDGEKRRRAIPLNMDYVKELGFDFEED